jgi:hypothetical protein
VIWAVKRRNAWKLVEQPDRFVIENCIRRKLLMSVTILYSISDWDSAEDGDAAFHEEAVLPDWADQIGTGIIAAELVAQQHFSDFQTWRDEYSDDTESAYVRVAIIEPDWIAGTYGVDLAVISDASIGWQVKAIRARRLKNKEAA